MSDITPNPETRIALFQRKEVRRTIHNNEWWFVVVDVVAALTDAADPTDYLNKIRRRDPELTKGYGQIVHPLSIQLEKKSGRKVVTSENYLTLTQATKKVHQLTAKKPRRKKS
jgi:prophage antirepressor-like protein